MLIENSNFISNSANIKGGAIFFECEEIKYNCKLEIRGSNFFTSNNAGESGGALSWDQVEPIFNRMSDIRFSKNFADIYANEIASIPAKIVYITEE
jgi:predicted outer membrane repeat protein